MTLRFVARLRAHGSANGALVIACSAAFAFVALIPIYINISGVAILRELTRVAEAEPVAPFSYFFSTDADVSDWDELAGVDDYLANRAASDLGLAGATVDARIVSRRFDTLDGEPLAFNAIDRFDQLVTVTDGQLPSANGDILEAMVGADHPSLSTGDELTLIDPTLSPTDPERFITVLIAGTWEPAIPAAQDWIVSPSVFDNELVVARSTLLGPIADERPPLLATAQWSITGDAAKIAPSNLARLSVNADRTAEIVADIAPSVSLTRDPSALLTDVAERRNELSSTLRSFAMPAGIVTAIFVAMVMTFHVQQRRTELAVLRSRGLPVRQAVATVASEVMAVIAVSAVLGSLGAMAAVQLMVRSQSFLDLGVSPSPVPFLQAVPWREICVTAAVMLFAHVLMLIEPARQTIVARQSRRGRLAAARTSVAASADLIIVAFVAALLLQRRSLPVTGLTDPWVIVTPAAAGLAVALLVVRGLPPVIDRAARGLDAIGSVSIFLGAQRMARASSSHRTPMLLIVVATALSAFVASLSVTLEQRLLDETYLVIGADHVISDITPGRAAAPRDVAGVDGVLAATRTVELDGRFGETKVSARSIEVIAIEPTTFLAASHWQSAFDDDSLDTLLAPLRTTPGAVLVSASLAETYDLSIGDPFAFAVAARVDSGGEVLWLDTGGVVGAVTERFPRWTGADKHPLVVMDLATLEAQADRLERATTLIRMDSPDHPLDPDIGAVSARQRVLDAQQEAERQAVFAILNATFVLTMTIALVSLIVQTMATFRERRLDIGVLRAMGLSRSSTRSLLAFDFIAIAVVGVVVGTVTGLAVSGWLIPSLGVAAEAELPPAGMTAWPLIAASAGAFVVVAIGIVVAVSPLLLRRKVFDALKLGETQ